MKTNLNKQKILSQAELKSLLHYNPDTGEFTRLKNYNNMKLGKAGHINKSGYIYIKVNYFGYLAHRLAWLYMTGEWPIDKVDHKDLNKSNNKWENLRKADDFKNNHNKKLSKRNTTGFKGIWFNKNRGKWEVRIHANGKKISLGRFFTKTEAAAAYDSAAKQHHGEFYREAL